MTNYVGSRYLSTDRRDGNDALVNVWSLKWAGLTSYIRIDVELQNEAPPDTRQRTKEEKGSLKVDR